MTTPTKNNSRNTSVGKANQNFANQGKSRPDIGGNKSKADMINKANTEIKNFKIGFSRTLNYLPENETYYGTIRNIEVWTTKTGTERMTVTINLDGSKSVFSTSTNYPLSYASPFNSLFASVADDNEDDVFIEDLINLPVMFETKIVVKEDGSEFCNVKYIEIDEEQTKKTTKVKSKVPELLEEDTEDDEEDELSHYFDEDEDEDE